MKTLMIVGLGVLVSSHATLSYVRVHRWKHDFDTYEEDNLSNTRNA